MCDYKNCKNRNQYCDECVHNKDLMDYYEPEETKRDLEAEMVALREIAVTEWLNYKASKKFIEYFEKVAAFTVSPESPCPNLVFACVHVEEQSLYATDGCILAQLYYSGPKKLIGKNVVKIEEKRVGICDQKFPDPEIVFRDIGDHFIPVPEKLSYNEFFDIVVFHLEDQTIAIKKVYYEKIMEFLQGKILFYFTPEENKPVMFAGKNGRVAVMPVRKGTY